MFCPHCGSKLEGTPKFCGFCGHKISVPAYGAPEGSDPAAGSTPGGFSQSPDLSGSFDSGRAGSDARSVNEQYGASGGYGGKSKVFISPSFGGSGSASGYDSDNRAGSSDNYGASGSGAGNSFGSSGSGAGSSYGSNPEVPPAAPMPPAYDPASGGSSYFDGTGPDLFGKMILLELLTLVTCSLATPWVLVDVLRWRKRHTVINGRRLDFDGTAGELFGHWIKWFLLSIVTCGIYAYFARIDYLKWERSHTFYEGESPYTNAGSRTSYFDGTVSEYVGSAVLASLITTFSCGIAGAWGMNMLNQYEFKGTSICGDRLVYSGTGGSLFGIYLVNSLLTLITCGIYSAWGTCALNRYIYSNVHVDSQRTW